MRSTVICVDDDKFLLSTLASQLQEWLGKNYAVEKAADAEEAMELLDDCSTAGTPVSVIICDYIMPGMRGDELLCKIHERDRSIRKIMLTGYTQVEAIVNTINNASLYRFISKPWDKKDMMLTVLEALKSYEQEKYNKSILQSFEKLYRGYEAQLEHIIYAVAGAADMRSGVKSAHSQKVAELSQEIGKKINLSADEIKTMRKMAAFHDIGRLALGDKDLSVIRGKEQAVYELPAFVALQNEGARLIFSHSPELDAELLRGICCHLEKFDGTGLKKMAGEDIPIEARIIGIANYYYVLIESGESHDAALKRLSSLCGTVFDPRIVAALDDVDSF